MRVVIPWHIIRLFFSKIPICRREAEESPRETVKQVASGIIGSESKIDFVVLVVG